MNKEKVVIVTGGGKGVGAGIVRELLCQNWQVVCAEKDASHHLENESEQFLFVQTDVAKESSVRNMVEETLHHFGRIDALVNNAGILPINLPQVQEMSLEVWNQFLNVNLTGAFLCSKYTLPYLHKTKGAIVNIASTRAYQSEGNDAPYAATKGALVAFTHTLAMEASPQVRVNCICPGWIDTGRDVLRKIDHTQHPVGRVGKPEDIASMCAFLLSEQAGFITGQSFVVDGGMTIKMIYQ